jgi:SecD/SecF fusion protein
VIAIGIGSIVAQGGLNLGVDFEGGRSLVVKLEKDVKVGDIRSAVKSVVGDASCEVKTFDTDNQVQIKTNYMLGSTEDNVDSIVRSDIKGAITAFDASLNPDIQQFILVNPTISEDIKEKSVVSILISLVAIFFYILVRFKKWQFGLGALIALFHDVLIVVSLFSIVRLFGVSFEIDSIFVAAMLTIVGYSINDTVVVFDRVREYLVRFTKGNLSDVFNDAINSTLSRTLMTSVTTLLVVAILFVFGGDALRGFSFALLIGVVVGTYSSIFIATPSVLDTSAKKISEDAKKENESKKK